MLVQIKKEWTFEYSLHAVFDIFMISRLQPFDEHGYIFIFNGFKLTNN